VAAPEASAILNRVERPAGFQPGLGIWISNGALSIADQGLLSGANFTLNICYARWLTPADYGLFSILLSVFLLLASFHGALILEPMSVFGPRTDLTPSRYFSAVFFLHTALTLSAGTALAIASLIAPASLTVPLRSLSCSLPLILSFWLYRRRCYVEGRPAKAVVASLTYGGLILMMLFATRNVATSSLGFVIMALAALAASLLLMKRGDCRPLRGLAEVNRNHWEFGKWLAGVGLLYWFGTSFYSPLVGFYAGLPGAAAYRSAENLTLPLAQIVAAGSLLLTPRLAQLSAERGADWMRRAVWKITALTALVAIVYASALVVAGHPVLAFFYRTRLQSSSETILPLLGLVAASRAIGDFGAGMGLRVFHRTDAILWSTLAGAAVSIIAGVVLLPRLGVLGAAEAALLASVVQSGIQMASFWKLSRVGIGI
jgi:O-antigen/teichoic acid export membrane protein